MIALIVPLASRVRKALWLIRALIVKQGTTALLVRAPISLLLMPVKQASNAPLEVDSLRNVSLALISP